MQIDISPCNERVDFMIPLHSRIIDDVVKYQDSSYAPALAK